jgi:hypothetical protein
MKKQALLFAFAFILGSGVAVGLGAPGPDIVSAAQGGDPGPPPDSGGGGGGGGGGGDVPDYGDLIILYRNGSGVPIPSPAVMVPDPETGLLVDGGLCWQPISAEELDYSALNPGDRVVFPMESTPVDGGWLIPVDQYNCAVEAAFATYTQEVDFGRINEARSPESVFASQLEDVVVKLATADTKSLDPAGRLVASTCGADEATVTSTVDSPLQNLAIYRQLMLTGTIGTPLPTGANLFDTAARGLGAASDKSGGLNVDMVAYLNQIMGLTDVSTSTILPKISETYREEVQGTIQLVEKRFLDYGQLPGPVAYGYDRGANFGALPFPAYIPADDPLTPEIESQDGWFEYLTASGDGGFEIVQGPILGAVFGDPFVGSNIGGFAQAADDTRAVIEFMHTNAVPIGYETPVTCTYDETGIAYDVSISDVSGLQVPKRMVDGSEGRDFIVTIANAGPDPASGTVTVTAVARNGVTIEGSPWTFGFTDLAMGGTESFPQFFSIDLGARTTIDWEAVVSADYDVNLSNNTVTATTSVKVTGGGGGGGRK